MTIDPTRYHVVLAVASVWPPRKLVGWAVVKKHAAFIIVHGLISG